MGPALLAFSSAAFVTLLLTPALRQVALHTGVVDWPSPHKDHSSPLPYLGGVAIMAGTLVAALFGAGQGQQVAQVTLIALAAAGLGVVGLLDDDRTLQPLPRLLAQLAAAGAVVAVGVRADVTGITVFDVALTMVWLMGVTNAVNFLDNMDGLAAGVTGAGAGAAFLLAALNGQVQVAALAAALAGACLGFLAFNARPAAIFMGDAGSLFVGFLLAAVVLEVQPEFVAPPASFAVPLLLVAIPVFDIATVVVSRLRRRIPVSTGGRNHLSHRLVVRGLSRGAAVGVLVAAEAVAGVLAVLVGAGLVSVVTAFLVTGVMLALLTAVTVTAEVYAQPVVGFSRGVRLAVGAAVVATVAAAAPAVAMLVLSGRSVRAGADASERALAAVRQGEAAAAREHFEVAAADFARSERWLSSPWVLPGLIVPILNANLDAVRTVSSAGHQLAEQGGRLSSSDRVQITAGRVPLSDLRHLGPELAGAAALLRTTSDRVAAADRSYLLSPVRDLIRGLGAALPEVAVATDRSAQAAELAPALLGGGGERRYLVAVDGAASTGTGVAVSWSMLVADQGRVRLEPAQPPEGPEGEAGAAAGLSRFPDFPAAARAVADRAAASGRPVDGVAWLDAHGLAALLHLTGPVSVPAWPRPVGGDDAALLSGEVDAGGGGAGVYSTLVRQVSGEGLRRLAGADVGSPGRLVDALGKAVEQRHLRLYLTRQGEQALVERLGAAGQVPLNRSDSLMVAGTNGAARAEPAVRYRLFVEPVGTRARVRGTLEVTMTDDPSPAAGQAAERTISVFTPLGLAGATLDGRPVDVRPGALGDWRQYTASVPAAGGTGGGGRTLRADLAGVIPLTADGAYALDLVPQPAPGPGTVEVSITLPPGWNVTQAPAMRPTGERGAAGRYPLDGASSLAVRFERTGLSGLWHRLRVGALT